MTNAWPPPSSPAVACAVDDPRAEEPASFTMWTVFRTVLASALLVALGVGLRFAFDESASSASGSDRLPTVLSPLPTEEFVQMTFSDPDGFEAVESTTRVSLAEPIGVISVTSASGDVVVTQFRPDGTYVKATNADVWVDVEAGWATENLFATSRMQARVFGTFDDFVDPRLQPFVIVEHDEQVVLPIEPIGTDTPGSEKGVETRHLVLRLDREALVESEPFAEAHSYFPEGGVLSLWVDGNGLIRQQDLSPDEDSSTLVRLDAVLESIPELETELGASTFVPLDQFDRVDSDGLEDVSIAPSSESGGS